VAGFVVSSDEASDCIFGGLIVRLVLGKQVVSAEGGLNWLSVMSNRQALMLAVLLILGLIYVQPKKCILFHLLTGFHL
jgi:hypothetical protein